jgi:hypothetical protein
MIGQDAPISMHQGMLDIRDLPFSSQSDYLPGALFHKGNS